MVDDRPQQSRREFLYTMTSGGLMLASLQFTLPSLFAEEDTCPPTPPNIEGPYYKPNAPERTQLSRADDSGMPLKVSGRVMNTRTEPIPEATIEIWQANHHGDYDMDGHEYRATLSSDKEGAYQFNTKFPGHYHINSYGQNKRSMRPQHIHYKVSADGYRTLITQLYFNTDPFFEGHPEDTFTKDPFVKHPELIRPVVLASKGKRFYTRCNFDICLEKA